MKILLSPTKKQVSTNVAKTHRRPLFINQSKELVSLMRALGRDGLQDLLGISSKLSLDNWQRISDWKPFCENVESPAMFTYTGEAFTYLDPESFTNDDIEYSTGVLRIFSGLYGILKPMDSIMPYRLDIKNNLKVPGYKSLYNYWKPLLTDFLIDDVKQGGDELIINLSSQEYSKSLDFNKISAKIITPDFKTEIDGKLRTIPIWSKRMRGLLARKLIKKRIILEDELKSIKLDGYRLENIDNGNYLYVKE